MSDKDRRTSDEVQTPEQPLPREAAQALRALTCVTSHANTLDMPHSFLIFDFGTNEVAAQQARHRLDGWKQGFRLDKKLQVKFERQESEEKAPESAAAAPAKPAKSAAKGKAKFPGKAKVESDSASTADGGSANPSKIRVVVRLDFSDHEKLSHQRWIERIPVEEPFKGANPRVVRSGEPEFKATSDLFDSLD